MNKILTVGTVAFDDIITPFGTSGKILGGAATHIVLAASRFNVNLGLVSVVGSDFPKEYLQLFRDRGINMDGVEMVKGGKTFYWKGRYETDLNVRTTLETQLNVLMDFQPKVPDAYKEPDILVLGNLDPSIQLKVLDQLTERPKLVLLDTMNYWIGYALESLFKVLKKVDVICINDEEARQITGSYFLPKAAHEIQKMGVKTVVIKKGEHGVLLFEGEKVYCGIALPLEEVFDPTGAGDTFIGGVAGYLLESGVISFENMKNAVIHGSNLASFCVEKFGVDGILNLTNDDIKKRLKLFLDLTNLEIDLI